MMNVAIKELEKLAAIAELFLKEYCKVKKESQAGVDRRASKSGLSKMEGAKLLAKRQTRINKQLKHS